ncbi:MAG: O-antigen ligase family protein, partial [Nitrosopumilaceae archaeon]
MNIRDHNTWWFTLIIGILFMQYVRPYEITGLTFLAAVRPYILLVTLLTGFIIFYKGRECLQLGSSQIRLLWLILLWMILHVPLAQVKSIAFYQTRDVILYMPFILSTVIVVNNVLRLRQFINILISIGVIISVRGLFLHEGFERGASFNLGNFLSDPNDFSLFMDMMLPFSFFLMMYEKNRIKKILYGVAAALCVLCTIVSFSRGGFLGLVFVGGVIWWYNPNKKLTTSVIAIAIVLTIIFAGRGYIDQMGQVTNVNDPTAQTRITMWKASWKVFT